MTVIDVASRSGLASLEQIVTKHGAHTGALDPRTGRLYLPTCDDGHAAGPGCKRPDLLSARGVKGLAPQ